MSEEPGSAVDYRWQCRRGMLELDLLLNNFVEKNATALTTEQQQSFERLLSYPDQTLLDLLLGNTVSSDDAISEVVELIQGTAFD